VLGGQLLSHRLPVVFLVAEIRSWAELSQLMLRARLGAMAEIQQQAQSLGADGVVGMRIEIEREGTSRGIFGRRHCRPAPWQATAPKYRDRHGRAFHVCAERSRLFGALVRGGVSSRSRWFTGCACTT